MSRPDRSVTYQYLLQVFGPDHLKDRYAFLLAAANQFIKDRDLTALVSVDLYAIESVVTDYFADIKRLKDFHGIKRINTVKIAAYTAFWLSKRRPLSLKAVPTAKMLSSRPYLQDINEWYCWYVVLSILFDAGTFLHHDAWEQWTTFMTTFNYFLAYRVVSPQAIELALLGLLATPIFPLISADSIKTFSD